MEICHRNFHLECCMQVVTSAAKCLRSDGVFCGFSPCIEQVHKTCAALSQSDFYNVRVMECLLRRYEVKTAELVKDVLAPTKPNPGNQSDSLAAPKTRKLSNRAALSLYALVLVPCHS